MRREAIGLFLAALIVVPAGAVQAAAPLGTPSRGSDRADPAGRWIVLTRNGADPKAVRDRHAHRDGIKADRLFAHAAHGFSSKLSGEQVAALRADPDVAAVVPDEVVTVAGQLTPTGVARIGTKLSSVAKIDGVDQRVDADVAVVDTGIDRTHPDLNVVGGVNCSSSDRTAWQDENHHGTHVAGTIGALDNGIGVVGVAPGVRLWAVRILDASGSGLLSWYVCGLDWIAAQRDPVDPTRPLIEAVNMSVTKWGSDDHNCGHTNNDILHQAICRVTAAGVTVVAAAANDSANASKRVPASYDEVITVSALADTDGKPGALGGNRCYSWGTYDKDDTFADFSNYGGDVDIIAPGKCIWSTLPGNTYGYSSGTSMAAPAVTGAVALYRASRPWTKPGDVRSALQFLGNLNWSTATDPDATHERLLDVSRVGPAGDFTVAVGTPDALGEAGGSKTVPVTLTRTPTHFETVAFKASSSAGITGGFSNLTLRGFTANATSLTITVPPSTPAGTYPLEVTATEGPHVHSATVDVVVENDIPTARAPSAAPAARGTLGAGTAPVLVTWPAASDPTSGIAAYEVQRSQDWAAWRDDVVLGASARSTIRNVAVNHTYRFRIRARDGAGNWSPWVIGRGVRIGLLDDTSELIQYASTWHHAATKWAWGGTTTWTDRNGAVARLTVAARELAVAGPVSANRGSVAVYVDGVYQATVSFYSATGASQRIVWSKTFDTDAVRTLELRAMTTASRPRVAVDAILIGR